MCTFLTPCRNSARRSFTLIELLVVVFIVAIVSALLMPSISNSVRKTRSSSMIEQQQRAQPTGGPSVLAEDSILPVFDTLDASLLARGEYERDGTRIEAYFEVEGSTTFRLHHNESKVMTASVVLPLPGPVLEVKNMILETRNDPAMAYHEPSDVRYSAFGATWIPEIAPGEFIEGRLIFATLGTGSLRYEFPKADQLRNVRVKIDVSALSAHAADKTTMRPSSAIEGIYEWNFKNLVSTRAAGIRFREELTPAGRVIALLKLLPVAVFLFGIGFLYLSEQYKPGHLDSFRWGHFLLLALTFSMFFVTYGTLGLHSSLPPLASGAIALAISLSLLTLHVARIVNMRFAIQRGLPLALLSLFVVLNHVYGGIIRPYFYLICSILIVSHLTITYRTWVRERDNRRQEKQSEQRERRQKLEDHFFKGITEGLLLQAAQLDARAAIAGDVHSGEAAAMSRARVEEGRRALQQVVEEASALSSRLSSIKPSMDGTLFNDSSKSFEQDLDEFKHRFESVMHALETANSGLSSQRAALSDDRKNNQPAKNGHGFCLYCGETSGGGKYCQQCGIANPVRTVCVNCGDEFPIPGHLIQPLEENLQVYCMACGGKQDPIDLRGSGDLVSSAAVP
jgi:prepilin-type N-terminal cleavage/methylation domain-containing protein